MAVFLQSVCAGLPLQVLRPILTAGAKGQDMVDDVAGAGAAHLVRGGAGMYSRKSVTRCATAGRDLGLSRVSVDKPLHNPVRYPRAPPDG